MTPNSNIEPSPSPIEHMGLLGQIDYVGRLLQRNAETELMQIAHSDTINEVIFNVVNAAKNGKLGELTPELCERIIRLAETRSMYLKSKFARGHQTNRSVPGKMEYDTTLEAVKDFKAFIKRMPADPKG